MSNIVIFTGGLGNQMFEYALVLALRSRGHYVRLDTSYYDFLQMHNGYELERVFGIREPVTSRQGLHIYWLRTLHKFRPKYLYKVDEFKYDETILQKPQTYLFGYWQDERYFESIANQIRDVFSFTDIDEYNQQIAKQMNKCNSVSLHIRRGDYAAFGMTIIKEDYYVRAIKKINSMVDNPTYFIFSDDMEESKAIVDKMNINHELISHNRKSNSYLDMFLMSQCKHNIIANSSFSWWGAWLNNFNERVVIAPQIWDAQNPNFHPQCKNWILL
jgi:hypothetical protein